MQWDFDGNLGGLGPLWKYDKTAKAKSSKVSLLVYQLLLVVDILKQRTNTDSMFLSRHVRVLEWKYTL